MSVPGTGNGAENLVEEGDERSGFMSMSEVDKEEVVLTTLGVSIYQRRSRSEERFSLEGLGICDLQADMAHRDLMSR